MNYKCYSCSEKQKKSKSGGNAPDWLKGIGRFVLGNIPVVGDNIVEAIPGLRDFEPKNKFAKGLQNFNENILGPIKGQVEGLALNAAVPGLGTAVSTVDNMADNAQGVGKDKKTGKSLNGINPLSGSYLQRFAQYGGLANKVKHVDGGVLNKISSTGIKAEGRLHEHGGININDEIEIEGGEGIHKLGNKTVISSDTLEDSDGYTFAEKMTELESKKGYLENRLKIEEDKGNKNTVIVLKKKIDEIDNEIKELYGKQELTAKEMGLRDKNGNPNQASQDIVPSPENPNPPGMLGKFGGSFKFRKRYQTGLTTDNNIVDKDGKPIQYGISEKTYSEDEVKARIEEANKNKTVYTDRSLDDDDSYWGGATYQKWVDPKTNKGKGYLFNADEISIKDHKDVTLYGDVDEDKGNYILDGEGKKIYVNTPEYQDYINSKTTTSSAPVDSKSMSFTPSTSSVTTPVKTSTTVVAPPATTTTTATPSSVIPQSVKTTQPVQKSKWSDRDRSFKDWLSKMFTNTKHTRIVSPRDFGSGNRYKSNKFQVGGNSELKFKQLNYKTPKNKPVYQGDDGLYYELKSDGTYANYTEGLRQGNDNIPSLATPPIVEYPKPKVKNYQTINSTPVLTPTYKNILNKGYTSNFNYNNDNSAKNETMILPRLNSYNLPFIETTPTNIKEEIVKVPVVVNNDNNTNNNNSKNKNNKDGNSNLNLTSTNMSKLTKGQLTKILKNLERIGNLKNPAQIAKFGGMKKRQIGGTASGATTTGASESSGFMDMLPNLLGSLGNMGSKKEEQPVPQQQPMYPPIVINNAVPETKPYFDQNQFAYDRMKLQNEMNYGRAKSGGDWIKDATNSIEKRGTEGRCSGSNFGGPDCPPGSRQYNLAVTFKKMAKREMGGLINTTGYLKGHNTNKNPYNIIPSPFITTKGMIPEPINATPIYANGMKGKTTRLPINADIQFPNAKYVLEEKVKKPIKAQNGLGMKKPYDPFELNPPLIPPVPKNMFPPVAPPPTKWDKFKEVGKEVGKYAYSALPAIAGIGQFIARKNDKPFSYLNEKPQGMTEWNNSIKNSQYNLSKQFGDQQNTALATLLRSQTDNNSSSPAELNNFGANMSNEFNKYMIENNRGIMDQYQKYVAQDAALKQGERTDRYDLFAQRRKDLDQMRNDLVKSIGESVKNFGAQYNLDSNQEYIKNMIKQFPVWLQNEILQNIAEGK